MDDFDRASEREEKDREAAIEAARGHYARCWEVASAIECVGCGALIPDARREAIPGVQLCVDCQAEAENQSRMYRYSGTTQRRSSGANNAGSPRCGQTSGLSPGSGREFSTRQARANSNF